MRAAEIVVGLDSWGWAVVAGRPEHRGWPALLGIPPANNLSICGSTSAEWAGRVDEWQPQLAALNPKGVILSCGGNDMRNFLANDNVVAPEEAETLIRSVQTILRAACAAAGRVALILYANPDSHRCGSQQAVDDVNALLKIASRPFPVELWDLDRILDDLCFDPCDTLHPILAGHGRIARYIRMTWEIE